MTDQEVQGTGDKMKKNIYFKLVDSNYRSFYDSNFKWPQKGIVEVTDAALDGDCGPGLHLGKSIARSLQYAKFPFRILEVRPVGPILGENSDKVRVAKAEVLRQLPIPAWAKKLEDRIAAFPQEFKNIPWSKGTDEKGAKKLMRSHFKLLVPFGFKLDFNIEVITDLERAEEAVVAWAAVGDASWDVSWATASAAASAASGAASITSRAAARIAAEDAAWAASWATTTGVASSITSRAAAWTTAWAASRAAAAAVTWDAAAKAKADLGANPFTPLWECWKLGVWPIGFDGNTFKIYVKKRGHKCDAVVGREKMLTSPSGTCGHPGIGVAVHCPYCGAWTGATICEEKP